MPSTLNAEQLQRLWDLAKPLLPADTAREAFERDIRSPESKYVVEVTPTRIELGLPHGHVSFSRAP